MHNNHQTDELDDDLEMIENYVDSAFRKVNRTSREMRFEQKTRHNPYRNKHQHDELER